MKLYALTLLLASCIVLSACSENSNETAMSSVTHPNEVNEAVSSAQVRSVNYGAVLATIDGNNIYEQELQSLLVDMLGESGALQLDKTSRRRALDSLLASYALAQQASIELSQNVIGEIDIKVRRYRENLLINMYMSTKMKVADLRISSGAIKAYYEKNLDKFGKSTIKHYQFLTTKNKLTEELREKYMSLVSSSRKAENLEDIKSTLEMNGFSVQLQSAELNKKYLSKRLYQFVSAQTINVVSDLTYIDGRPYIIKLITEKTVAARPLARVRDTIRKSLVLKKLKEAIKRHSTEILAISEVVYSE